MGDTISVVIPVYNEEKGLRDVIEKLKGVLLEGQGYKYEVIVVDDGSKDKTPEILREIDGIKVITHPHNMGYGKALRTGIGHAVGNWILIIDADGSYKPEDVSRLIECRGSCDMVVGLRGSRAKYDSSIRRPAKWFLSRLASYLAGVNIPDLNSGLRVFRKETALKFWHLFPDGFSFTTTLTMCLLGSNSDIDYVNIDYLERIGESKIRPFNFLQFVNLVIRLVMYFEPLKVFVPVSLSVFVMGVSLGLYSFFHLHKIMDVTVVVLLLSSLQIFLFGLLAELIVKRSGK